MRNEPRLISSVILLLMLVGEPSFASWKYEVSGDAGIGHKSFFDKIKSNALNNNETIVNANISGQYSVDSWFQANIISLARLNLNSEFDREKQYFDLPEANLKFFGKGFEFLFGNSTYNWGILDIYSPLDVVNQKTYFDPLNTIKRGAKSLDIKYDGGNWQIQGLYLPSRITSVYPAEDSRWLPREVILNAPDQVDKLLLPDEFNYTYNSETILNDADKNNYGIRFSTYFWELEAFFVHYKGMTTSPEFGLTADTIVTSVDPLELTVDSDIELSPVYNLQEVNGGSLVWTNDFAIVRTEVAKYDLSDSSGLLESSTQSALGVEYPFALLDKSWTFVAQYYKASHSKEGGNFSGSAFRIFDDTLALSLILALSDRNSIVLGGIFDSENDANVVNVSADLRVTEKIRTQLKYLAIDGPEQTLLGTYKNNDYLQLNLVAFF